MISRGTTTDELGVRHKRGCFGRGSIEMGFISNRNGHALPNEMAPWISRG
jgi:hypothetical protein